MQRAVGIRVAIGRFVDGGGRSTLGLAALIGALLPSTAAWAESTNVRFAGAIHTAGSQAAGSGHRFRGAAGTSHAAGSERVFGPLISREDGTSYALRPGAAVTLAKVGPEVIRAVLTGTTKGGRFAELSVDLVPSPYPDRASCLAGSSEVGRGGTVTMTLHKGSTGVAPRLSAVVDGHNGGEAWLVDADLAGASRDLDSFLFE